MVPVPLSFVQPSRNEPLEAWPQLDQRVLRPSRNRSVCLTCHFFRHHPGVDGIPLLACHLNQGLIGHGEQISQCCANWTDDLVRQRGWAPEVA
jgi:hypothetical protein